MQESGESVDVSLSESASNLSNEGKDHGSADDGGQEESKDAAESSVASMDE